MPGTRWSPRALPLRHYPARPPRSLRPKPLQPSLHLTSSKRPSARSTSRMERQHHKSPRLRLDPEPAVTRAAEGIEAGADPNRRDIQISDAPSVLCLAGAVDLHQGRTAPSVLWRFTMCNWRYRDDTDVEPYHPANSTRCAA